MIPCCHLETWNIMTLRYSTVQIYGPLIVSYYHICTYSAFFLLGRPNLFLSARSPSTSQLLAFEICTTFTHCLKAMTGNEMMHKSQGTKLSILLALPVCQPKCLEMLPSV